MWERRRQKLVCMGNHRLHVMISTRAHLQMLCQHTCAMTIFYRRRVSLEHCSGNAELRKRQNTVRQNKDGEDITA